MRCEQLRTELEALKANANRLQQTNNSNMLLLQKHEQCAVDGTHTIEALQESLAKVCEQITVERSEYNDRLNQISKAFSAKENSLIHEIENLKMKLTTLQIETDSREITPTTKRGEQTLCNQERNKNIQSTPVSQNDSQDSSPRKVGESGHIMVHSNGTWSNDVIAPWRHVISENIEDVDDDEVIMSSVPFTSNSTSTPTRRTVTKTFFSEPPKPKGKEDSPHDRNDCRCCGDEPFGFMIKCQKCKDLFHAGCVNSATKTGKRRVGHAFVCSSCAPQRPHKVQRTSIISPGLQQTTVSVTKRPTLN